MKFRNKIFLMMILISLLTLVSLSAVSVIQFLHTKTEVRNRLEEQKDILYATNMEIMTGSQEDSVKSFAYEYASTLENNLDEIEQELTVMASYLQKMYRDGVSEQSAYSDSLVYLQPGVTYEEVDGEFQSIKSVRDMIHIILPEDSRSMIYYVTQSGMLLSDLEIDYGSSEVDRRERDWYIAAAESGSICWMPPYKDALTGEMRETLEHAIDQMNFRKQVYDNWHYTKKYPYGRGLSVLLFGAPGTGKSMCAQVIAHELNLELYRVDLSKVIDKYVGETEKSISMIFREAKKCNVVLFFDECDTLFAKRSDDGGSNQASNNNKTALLLQEVEAYDGVSVLATNYKHNIDPAFFRRMKYIVEFQFPNADTREMLWRTTIPKDTPLAEDVDIRFLAEKFEFAGGNIKNCILNAAFLAAADGDGKEVRMKHYLQAIRYEYVKTGKVFTRSDFEPYAEEVFGMELG